MDHRLRRIVFAGNGFPFAAAVVVAAAVLLLPLRPLLAAPTVMLVFVPVIISLARLFGVQVSAAASVLAFFALDFLFLPPYYRLAVGSLPEWLGLCVFLIVALVAGQQTGQLRRREMAAVRRQAELELLNALSARIASATSAEEIAAFVVRQVEHVLRAKRAALYVPGTGTASARCLASAGSPSPSSGEEALVAWAIRHRTAVGLTIADESAPVEGVRADEAVPGIVAEGVYVPMRTGGSIEGVLHAVLPPVVGAESADPSLLPAVANLVAATFERQRLAREAAHAEALREADRLRTTFVSSVSHELKTPLAAATARITGLLDEAATAGRVREELTDVAEDLGRLNASIGDLLDLSRLESDAWRPVREPAEVGDVLGTMLSRLPAAQRPRVRFHLAEDLPLVCCDFAQMVRALAIVVENALGYSPPDAPVVVTSREAAGEVLVEVEDRGPGIPDAEKDRIFDKFYRGAAASRAPGGTGLGLALAHEIVRTHAGRMWVEDVRPTGSRFVVALPAGPCEEGERGSA